MIILLPFVMWYFVLGWRKVPQGSIDLVSGMSELRRWVLLYITIDEKQTALEK
jgi:hypothetical protein